MGHFARGFGIGKSLFGRFARGLNIGEALFGRLARGFGSGKSLLGRLARGFRLGELFGRQLARGLQLASQRGALGERRVGPRVGVTTLALSGCFARGLNIGEALLGRLARGFGIGKSLLGGLARGFHLGEPCGRQLARGLELTSQRGAPGERRVGPRVGVAAGAFELRCPMFGGLDAHLRRFEIGASFLGGGVARGAELESELLQRTFQSGGLCALGGKLVPELLAHAADFELLDAFDNKNALLRLFESPPQRAPRRAFSIECSSQLIQVAAKLRPGLAVALERCSCLFELRLERRLRVLELRPDGMACRALCLDQPLRVGVDCRHLLRRGELRFEARPRGGGLGFSRRDARQLDHQCFEGLALVGVRQRRFERRQPGVEGGAKVLELSGRFGETEPERGIRRPGIGFCEGGSAHLDPESGVDANAAS